MRFIVTLDDWEGTRTRMLSRQEGNYEMEVEVLKNGGIATRYCRGSSDHKLRRNLA